MKSLVLFCLLALSFFAPAPSALAQGTSPSPTAAPVPSIAPGTDPATATRAWLDTVPPDKKAKSDSYFEGGYWLILWNFLVAAAISIFLLASRISARLRDFAERRTRFKSLQVVIYAIAYLLLVTLLSFPLTVYQQFYREHQYGLATQTFGPWFAEQLTQLCVALIAGVIVLPLFYFVFLRAWLTWWIWGTMVAVLFLFVSILIAPVYLEPLFNTYKPLTNPEIRDPI